MDKIVGTFLERCNIIDGSRRARVVDVELLLIQHVSG
jgi:hypothetical protein